MESGFRIGEGVYMMCLTSFGKAVARHPRLREENMLDVYFRTMDVLVPYIVEADVAAADVELASVAAALIAEKVTQWPTCIMPPPGCKCTDEQVMGEERRMLNHFGFCVASPTPFDMLHAMFSATAAAGQQRRHAAVFAMCATRDIGMYYAHSSADIAAGAVVASDRASGEPSAAGQRYGSATADRVADLLEAVYAHISPRGTLGEGTPRVRVAARSRTLTPVGCVARGKGAVPVPALTEVRLLGTGSFGSVILCSRAESPATLVAVKVRRVESPNGDVHGDVVREVAFLRTLPEHAHIVRCLEAFEDGGAVAVVYEFCGVSLADRVPRPTPDLARRLMYQLALAMDHLHGYGFMHCDLKLENLLYDGTLKVADFGSSSAALPVEGVLSACPTTVSHAAPETLMAAGEHRAYFPADAWAAGVVCLELLSGENHVFYPRGGPRPTEAMVMHHIASILGAPTVDAWPGLAGFKPLHFTATPMATAADLARRFHAEVDAMAMTLRLLRYDPGSRATFEEILQDPYFANEVPPPAPPQEPLLRSASVRWGVHRYGIR